MGFWKCVTGGTLFFAATMLCMMSQMGTSSHRRLIEHQVTTDSDDWLKDIAVSKDIAFDVEKFDCKIKAIYVGTSNKYDIKTVRLELATPDSIKPLSVIFKKAAIQNSWRKNGLTKHLTTGAFIFEFKTPKARQAMSKIIREHHILSE